LTVGLLLVVTWKKGERKNKTGRSKNDQRIEKQILWKKKKNMETTILEEKVKKTKTKDIKARKH